MATVALGAVRAQPDSTKFLLLGVVVVGGGLAWYFISNNPLGKLVSKYTGLLTDPFGFVKSTFNYGFSGFSSSIKSCKKGNLAQNIGCGAGGIGKTVFGFFSK